MPDDEQTEVWLKAPLPLLVTHPHLKSFLEFLDEFNKETERGAALAALAFVDDLLARVLASFLIGNDSAFELLHGANAPLGTVSARITACRAMGLIDEQERKECDLLRKIRNEFAHKVKMSFEERKCRSKNTGSPDYARRSSLQPNPMVT